VNILHLPTEIAGQSYLTAKGLREIGHNSIKRLDQTYMDILVITIYSFVPRVLLKNLSIPYHF